MDMKRANIAFKMVQYSFVSIGLAVVVVGFLNDADLVTFIGVFLVMAPFFVRGYIQTKRKYDKTL